MNRKLSIFLIAISLTAILAACTPAAVPTSIVESTAPPTQVPATSAPKITPSAASNEIKLTDGLGHTVTLKKPAQKIISLAPSNTEILFALGAGSQVVGRDELSDFPAEVKSLPVVSSFKGPNLEEITKLQPDLVIASELNTPEQVKSIENLGIPVFYLNNPTQLMDGLYDNLNLVAKLVGRQEEADQLIQKLKERTTAVVKSLSKETTKPKVYYEIDATDPAKPWTAGPGSFVDQLITLAGGENVASKLGSSWAQISQEDLIVSNPDLILMGNAGYGMTADQIATRPGWNGIKAVKDQKIQAFDDNLASRPGPRLVDGLEQMARLLHPEAFQ